MKKSWLSFLRFALILFTSAPALAQNDSSVKNAAILIFDGVQIIDYTGPYEVIGYGFNVFTVSQTTDPVTTNMGMKVIPNYSFENCPPADIIIVPGGHGVAQSIREPKLINWILEQSKKARVIMSVCNGAFLLAKAGLLDGLEVTTTSSFIDSLQLIVPSAHVVRNKRFVDNGKIITTAGLSSGIDGALHIAVRLLGPAYGSLFARWLEYDWSPRSKYAAASLADCNTLNIERFLFFTLNGEPVRYEGDTRHWYSEISINSLLSLDSLVTRVNQTIVSEEKWSPVKPDPGNPAGAWIFTGKNNRHWTGVSKVTASGKKNQYLVSVSIRQD
jgi:putative intracellular protease/amidase